MQVSNISVRIFKMTKIKAGNIETGMYLMHLDKPHKVVKKKFVSPGKGSAFTKTKLENLVTGGVVDYVFKSHDVLDEIEVESREMQFLYTTGDQAVFMDPYNYEQLEVALSVLGTKKDYLVPEIKAYVIIYKDQPLTVIMPMKIEMEVVEAEEAVAGDRSSAGTKPVTMSTGLVVQVPLFIKQGERLIVDTTTGKYVSRA